MRNPAKLFFARSLGRQVSAQSLLVSSVFALLASARAAVPDYAQTLRISEFMAVNNSGLQDADGEFSDWIEIHNPTPAMLVTSNGQARSWP